MQRSQPALQMASQFSGLTAACRRDGGCPSGILLMQRIARRVAKQYHNGAIGGNHVELSHG